MTTHTEKVVRRGRHPLPQPSHRITVVLSLRAGEDADLLAWFATIPVRHRASRIKAALRQGGATFVVPTSTTDTEMSDDAFADLLDAL